MTAGAAGPRLLMVSTFYDSHLGGLEIVAARVADELAARGFQVRWLATHCTAPPEGGRVVVAPIPGSNWIERRFGVPMPLIGPTGIARLAREVRAADAVLVHDSLYATSIAAALVAKVFAKPLVVVQHIGPVPYRSALLRAAVTLGNRMVTRPMLAAAVQVVFISDTIRAFFADARFATPPQTIFNGVDAEVFKPAPLAAARARLGLAGAGTMALFVGRFVEKKGMHLLHRAAAARPDVTWLFAGGGPIDPAAWGLSNVRVFSGRSGAALAELYQASDVFVLPSRGEGFPLVIQEALASGLPVVCGAESAQADPAATRLLDAVALGEDEGENLDRFQAAVRIALTRKAEARARAEFAHGRYSWSAAADRYAELFRALLGAATRPASPNRAAA